MVGREGRENGASIGCGLVWVWALRREVGGRGLVVWIRRLLCGLGGIWDEGERCLCCRMTLFGGFVVDVGG